MLVKITRTGCLQTSAIATPATPADPLDDLKQHVEE